MAWWLSPPFGALSTLCSLLHGFQFLQYLAMLLSPPKEKPTTKYRVIRWLYRHTLYEKSVWNPFLPGIFVVVLVGDPKFDPRNQRIYRLSLGEQTGIVAGTFPGGLASEGPEIYFTGREQLLSS
ncbi:hypothetical protein DFH06DRAFT_1130537 [Mycena polygramma]|nr:hypothetical protein DFH06DRAFT_1130537 [Mycena polygramma]